MNGTLNLNETVGSRSAATVGRTAPARTAILGVGAMKPVASLSLDADNQWSYEMIRGEPDWESAPSYLGRMVPRVLDLLAARDLFITFFLIGRDAATDGDAFAALAAAGHEIGNHSFRHQPWLHRYSEAELDEELDAGGGRDRRDHRACGPRGFRGPGYSLSEPTLRVLVRRGLRVRREHAADRDRPDRAHRLLPAGAARRRPSAPSASTSTAAGRDGTRPLRPYRWTVDGATLLEMPISTLPGLRVPIHVSYLLALSTHSEALARRVLRRRAPRLPAGAASSRRSSCTRSTSCPATRSRTCDSSRAWRSRPR